MSQKFDHFVREFEALCAQHAVELCASEDGSIQVYDLEPGAQPLDLKDIYDFTTAEATLLEGMMAKDLQWSADEVATFRDLGHAPVVFNQLSLRAAPPSARLEEETRAMVQSQKQQVADAWRGSGMQEAVKDGSREQMAEQQGYRPRAR